MASDSRNLRRKSGAVATTANTTTQYVTMQPATSASSQRGNRVATSISVSRKTTNSLSAEPCAEIVETADTNDLSALKQEQTPLRREFVRGGMMLRLSVNHKETRAYFQ